MTRVFKMAAAMVSTNAKVFSVAVMHTNVNSTRIEMTCFKPLCFMLLLVSVPYDMIYNFRSVDAD